ncbi:unnamed protein product [Paramecium sonneborni]|uniref:Uncharacterized protein n=2 Tax=Paramecium sonneborni TaxID=65129 RepID=A0A8S1RQ81_9CILI|nr:unnamed protein product [Paramecium sonneborni]
MKVERWDIICDRNGNGEYKFMQILKYLPSVVVELMIMREIRQRLENGYLKKLKCISFQYVITIIYFPINISLKDGRKLNDELFLNIIKINLLKYLQVMLQFDSLNYLIYKRKRSSKKKQEEEHQDIRKILKKKNHKKLYSYYFINLIIQF